MKVPVAGVIFSPGSGWVSPAISTRHVAYAYLTNESFEADFDDPSNYFWDTDGRKFNDCVHSKRVGFSTGRTVLPVMVGPAGQRVLQEDGSYDSSLVYPFTQYRCDGGVYLSWGCNFNSTQTRGTTFSVSCKFVTGSSGGKLTYREGACSIKYRFTARGKPYSVVTKESDTYGFMPDLVLATLTLMSGKLCYPRDPRKSWDLDVQYQIQLAWSHIGESIANQFYLYLRDRVYLGVKPYPAARTVSVSLLNIEADKLPLPYNHMLFHEDDIYANKVDPYLVCAGHDLSNYWRNVMIQQAYLDALQSVPRLNENSISNIIEIAGFIKNLVVDHRIEIPKSLGSAWLSYRYQYTTSKLDAEEAIKFVHRHMDIGSFSQGISCYGRSQVEYKGVVATCRCGVKVKPKDVNTLDKIWRGLYTYGLQPNFYVIWDMIPFSFIVDWLIPIGTLASVLDAERMYSETYYDISDVIFSISYDVEDDGNWYHQYTRWCQGTPPELNGFYFFETKNPSKRTVGYRILDALSLVIG